MHNRAAKVETLLKHLVRENLEEHVGVGVMMVAMLVMMMMWMVVVRMVAMLVMSMQPRVCEQVRQ